MDIASDSMLCASCIAKPATFDRCIALYRYQDGARKLVTEFKFNAKFAAGRYLAEQLAEKVNTHYRHQTKPDAVLPIPMHRTRLLTRGYNQSLLLAQRISHLTDIPIISHGLHKPKATPAQSSLDSAAARSSNLRGAFKIKPWGVSTNSVILIDDVVTTQATLREATNTLLAAGVNTVTCFCVARAN